MIKSKKVFIILIAISLLFFIFGVSFESHSWSALIIQIIFIAISLTGVITVLRKANPHLYTFYLDDDYEEDIDE